MVGGEELDGVGSATVRVTVEDANDHAPQFIGTPYSFDVLEDQSVGTSVGNVSANDTDGSTTEVGVACGIVHVQYMYMRKGLGIFLENHEKPAATRD